MDRSMFAELMPIVWRPGTGEEYRDYPRAEDLAAVSAMGESVTPRLTHRLEGDGILLAPGPPRRSLVPPRWAVRWGRTRRPPTSSCSSPRRAPRRGRLPDLEHTD